MADEMEVDTQTSKGTTVADRGGKKRFEVKKVCIVVEIRDVRPQ